MAVFGPPRRRVEYTSDVEELILAAIDEHERLGDIVLAFEDLIRHELRPSASLQVREPNGTEVRVLRFEKEYGAPDVTFVYEIEDDEVIVFAIRIA